jgi:hypothetical protein
VSEIRIALDEQQFRQLVAGKEIVVPALLTSPGRATVRIILSDIGFDRMAKAIADATSVHDETRL